MQVKIGKFAEGFAWMLTDEGRLIDQGYASSESRAEYAAGTALKNYRAARYEYNE